MRMLSLTLFSVAVGLSVNAAPSFYLPDVVYATPGLECSVYYKNIIKSVVPQNFSYQTSSKVGTARLARWHWTPEAKDAGTTNALVIRAWNDDGVVACLTTRVVVAELPKDVKKKVVFALFADSLTNSGYQRTIYEDMMSAGCSNFVSVGTRPAPPNFKDKWIPHEGIPGYTCSAFLNYCQVTEDELANAVGTPQYELYKALGKPKKIEKGYDREFVRSPLIKNGEKGPVFGPDGKPVVDIQQWMDRVNGGEPPDIVMVQLGVNDVIWLKGEEESLRKQIRVCVMPWYRKFLATLQAKMPKTRFVFTTQPIGADQDAFGENYHAGWNEIQHRKIMFALNQEIERFVKECADPRVELLNVAQAVDPFYGFHHWKHPVSAREKEVKDRATNAVHVSKSGGDQMADAMAAWILANWNSL